MLVAESGGTNVERPVPDRHLVKVPGEERVGVGVFVSGVQQEAVVVHRDHGLVAAVLDFEHRADGTRGAVRGCRLLGADELQRGDRVVATDLHAVIHVLVRDGEPVAGVIGLRERLP